MVKKKFSTMWNIVIYLPECISHLSFTSRWSNFNPSVHINLTKFFDFQSSGNIFDSSSDADGHVCWFEIKKKVFKYFLYQTQSL